MGDGNGDTFRNRFGNEFLTSPQSAPDLPCRHLLVPSLRLPADAHEQQWASWEMLLWGLPPR